jgi:proline iminopeptidase
MKIFLSFVLGSFLFISAGSADMMDGLYVKAYGDSSRQPIVFIHGGPGYDSQAFEFSTAQVLADAGYYVIVYDQRGQGRSDVAATPEVYQYKAYADDLKKIIDFYGLKRPILMGHSHGGAIALKFEQFYPQVAEKILLVSAPVDMWSSIEAIKINCTTSYSAAGDSVALGNLQAIFAKLETPGLPLNEEIPAISEAFQQAFKCGVYASSAPAANYQQLMQQIYDKSVTNIPTANLIYPMGNFVIYEDYIHLDNTQLMTDNADRVFAIYGDDDGLFTFNSLNAISQGLVTNPSPYRFQVIHQASHNVFIDQQEQFVQAVVNAITAY